MLAQLPFILYGLLKGIVSIAECDTNIRTDQRILAVIVCYIMLYNKQSEKNGSMWTEAYVKELELLTIKYVNMRQFYAQ